MGKPTIEELLASLKEIEELLQFPGVPGHVHAATLLATRIAKNAPEGRIANLAMRVISEANALRESALPLRPDRSGLNAALWRLRIALQQATAQARSTAKE